MSLFEIILVTPLIFGVICIILGFLYYGLMYIGISLYILHFPFKWTVKLLNKIFKLKISIKDIENKHFTKSGFESERILYAFLKPTSKSVRKKETTKHYLNKAATHIEENSYRDCLMECRRALENLSNILCIES